MKKRNLGIIILSFAVLASMIFFFNYVFAATQTVSIDTSQGEAGVFHNYTITLLNTDPKLNITQANLTVSASFLNITSYGTNTTTNTPTIIGSSIEFTNSSISLIKSNSSGLFWFYATTNQTGVITINVSSLDNNSAITVSPLTITINDTQAPTINFVNQTASLDGTNGATNIPVNVSASDSGSGIKSITIYLSNSSGLVGGTPITNTTSFYTDFTGLVTGTYRLWAIAFDNANNSASTSNYTIGVTFNSSSCTPNWNISTLSTCVNGTQLKTFGDYNNCGVTTGQPAATNQSCTLNSTCVTSWSCTDWSPSVCASDNGTQTRTCTDSSGCSSPQTETRDCALGSAITTNNSTSQTSASAFSLSSAFFIVMGIIVISVVAVIFILMKLRKKSYSTDFGNSGQSSGYKSFSPRSPPSGFPGQQNSGNFRN
jgi:hypothetical protein